MGKRSYCALHGGSYGVLVAADLRDSPTSPEPASLLGRHHQLLAQIHSSSAMFPQEPLGC